MDETDNDLQAFWLDVLGALTIGDAVPAAVDDAGGRLKVPLGILGTERIVPLDETALDALDHWTGQRGTQHALPHPRTADHCRALIDAPWACSGGPWTGCTNRNSSRPPAAALKVGVRREWRADSRVPRVNPFRVRQQIGFRFTLRPVG